MTLEPTINNPGDHLRDADLAADLAAFAAPASASGLATRALATANARGTSALGLFRGDWKHAAAVGAVGFLILVVVAGVVLPSLGTARSSVRRSVESQFAVSAPASPPTIGGVGEAGPGGDADGAVSASSQPRQVIRTADLEVRVASVRDSFKNASSLVREDLGEFISQTTFSGVEPYTSATVTLRVNADRLQGVLASLRTLGDVTSESTGGEDVTDQLVDLDARLRNERRIEQELLTLLDTRKDAPLEDILKVRESLGRIRENIERLTAQQAQLTNRVALANINARLIATSEPVAREQGLLEYMVAELGHAWRWSLRALIGTVSFLLAVTVGGLIWWIILGAVALGARRWWKRRQRRLAAEPPPAI